MVVPSVTRVPVWPLGGAHEGPVWLPMGCGRREVGQPPNRLAGPPKSGPYTSISEVYTDGFSPPPRRQQDVWSGPVGEGLGHRR